MKLDNSSTRSSSPDIVVERNANYEKSKYVDKFINKYKFYYSVLWMSALLLSVLMWVGGTIESNILIIFCINMFVSGYVFISSAKNLSYIPVIISVLLMTMSLTMLGLVVYRPDFGTASMHYYAQITLALGIVVSLLINRLWFIKVEDPRERINTMLVDQDKYASIV